MHISRASAANDFGALFSSNASPLPTFLVSSSSWLSLLFSLLLLLCTQQSVQAPGAFTVQLHKVKISDNNNTTYVREIMRRAKSAEMRNYMQPEADACDNFFTYACGNWPQINPANGEFPRETNIFQHLTANYNQKQLKLLQERPQNGETEAMVMVRDFYESCASLRGMQGGKYKQKLRGIIREFGRMPALLPSGIWDESQFDWIETIASIQRKYNIRIILTVYVIRDFEADTPVLVVSEPDFKLKTRPMYMGEATKLYRDLYWREIENRLQKYLGLETQRATSVAREILNFEMQLARGMIKTQSLKLTKVMTKERSLDELQQAYAPTIDIEKLVLTRFEHNPNITIYESNMEYQQNLVEVIKGTPKAQLANYIMYQLVEKFFFDTEVTRENREYMCLHETKSYFSKLLDNMIFHKYHHKDMERDLFLIWQELKQTFKDELTSDRVDWMTWSTRSLALKKLEAMKLEINSYNETNFTEEYDGLKISKRDFIENVKALFSWSRTRASLLSSQVDDLAHILSLPVLPEYIGLLNEIRIPVSFLQPNFLWSENYPQALKYGTLGYMVAHELMHGFDDMGRNLDADGNEGIWWDNSTLEAFNERKACIQRQYAFYRYGGKYLPESDVQAENIADNAAVPLAYSAYMKWLASVEDQPQATSAESQADTPKLAMESLPNINSTNKQLFFISFAQFWCNDANELFRDKESLVNLHAPAMFRVIGSLANFDEFANAFHCARGTTMNPHKKCKIY